MPTKRSVSLNEWEFPTENWGVGRVFSLDSQYSMTQTSAVCPSINIILAFAGTRSGFSFGMLNLILTLTMLQMTIKSLSYHLFLFNERKNFWTVMKNSEWCFRKILQLSTSTREPDYNPPSQSCFFFLLPPVNKFNNSTASTDTC